MKTVISIVICALFAFIPAMAADQPEMNAKECQAAIEAGAKRELAAKQSIAETQASLASLKEQIKTADKQISKNRSDAFAAAGTTPQGLAQWKNQAAELMAKADALAAAGTEEVIARSAEVPGMESTLAALKQDRAVYMTGSSELMAAAETSVANAQAAVTRAQGENAASAAAAKQAQIDEKKRKAEEAKQAKLMAKQQAEEERQARLEAKRAASAEAASASSRSVDVASGDPLAGLEDLVAGTTYIVKDVPNNRQTLAKMARKLWGDPLQWTRIYEANKEKMDRNYEAYKRANPDGRFSGPETYLLPGTRLVIPQ